MSGLLLIKITAAVAICAVAVIALWAVPASAGPHRHRPRGFCVPVVIEGAGTVRICPPARAR